MFINNFFLKAHLIETCITSYVNYNKTGAFFIKNNFQTLYETKLTKTFDRFLIFYMIFVVFV